MRISSIHCCVCMALLATSSLLIANDSATRATIDLSPNFPADLPTIVCGTLNRDAKPGSAFMIPHPSLDSSLVGQVGAEPRKLYFAVPHGVGRLVGRESSQQDEGSSESVSLPLDANITKATNGSDHVKIRASDVGFTFFCDDRSVLLYQRLPVTQHGHTRAGFVHPLIGLDGEVFTETFPRDHRHHQGVFWAWHQLWVGDRKIGDPWVTKNHLLVVKNARIVEQGPVFATLDIQAEWTSTDTGDSHGIVAEQTRVRVFRAVGDVQYVDFTIQLRALVDGVKIGGSEDVKGYSGFTVRVKPPRDMVIRDATGVLDSDAVQSASPWAGVSGSFTEGKTSGVAILCHPSVSPFPPRWVLRHYGMQNVAYPGREPIALSRDAPCVIRHRLVLHRGNTAEARIAEHQRVYELSPPG